LKTNASNGKKGYYKEFLMFEGCNNLVINGKGEVDGLGYDWWIREWKNKNKAKRPNLLQITRT